MGLVVLIIIIVAVIVIFSIFAMKALDKTVVQDAYKREEKYKQENNTKVYTSTSHNSNKTTIIYTDEDGNKKVEHTTSTSSSPVDINVGEILENVNEKLQEVFQGTKKTTKTKKCPNCGHILKYNETVCPYCGTNV